MRSSPSTSILRSSFWASPLLWALGCSSGEVHLWTGAEPLANQEESPGAVDDTPSASGGGSSDSPGGDNRSDYELPCFAEDACDDFCSGNSSECLTCSDSSECSGRFTFCDEAAGHCAECLDDSDCVSLFDLKFPQCSEGHCVQCQTSNDCGPDLRCDHGWCGACSRDSHCPDGLDCHFGRCIQPGGP